MARQSTCNKALRLKERGKNAIQRFWSDERGIWMIPFCLFLILVGFFFISMRHTLGMERYARDALFTAVDAASLAGAEQTVQQVTTTDAYGDPETWIYVVDEQRAEDHALQTFDANASDLRARGLVVGSPVVSYPDNQHVRVDVDATYTAKNLSQYLQTFFGGQGTVQGNIHVHAIAQVKQLN